jgi:penicillin-binding protein 1A
LAVTPIQPPEPSVFAPYRRLQAAPEPPRQRRKLAGKFALALLLALAVITGSLAGLTLVYSVDLPQIHDLEHYRPSTVTELYDRKGRVIGSFAIERREVINYNDFAPVLRQAVISIEDKNFESHWGINVLRIGGALWHDLVSHGRAQGASTLTMQLARNLFLSSERTAGRKLQEAYLAIQIERAFTKQQIFTLYGNQIYLGSGMYGFEAASQFYFSKHARDLTLTEAALLAGLPKGPVAYSPILNPEKCLRRRNLVLTEMESDRVISHEQAEQARNAPLGLNIAQPEMSVAPWFEEAVRQELDSRFGADEVHEAGMKIETTLDLDLQKTANAAVADGLATYERRRGWVGQDGPGKLQNVLASGSTIEDYRHPDWVVKTGPGDYVHAVVTRVLPLEIHARVGKNEVIILPEDWQWTKQRLADALVKPGDIIYVHLTGVMEGAARRATLEQDSGAQGSLLAVDNASGDVLAMVGGRDYALSQFNRATQAQRQTGSSFKIYDYTAAIEDGAKPDDIIVDGPVSFGSYTPHNYENDYRGAMTLTNAFAESRNIPALKLAARVGIHKVIDVTHRFGVTTEIPAYLPIAIGAVEITLEEQVASYSVFPNDGIRVSPRLIRKVTNADGITLWSDPPAVNEVIGQPTARTMMTLLKAVIQHGTGAAASHLNHPLGGKTGTTSDYTDAWFLGFSPSVTCGVWVGYDSRQSLGEKETGARAALPIWMTLMRAAINGKDDEQFPGDVKANFTPTSATPPAQQQTPAPLAPSPKPLAPSKQPAPSSKQPPASKLPPPLKPPSAPKSGPPANSEPSSKLPPHARSGAALAAAKLPTARPAAGGSSSRPMKSAAHTGPRKNSAPKTAAPTGPAEKPSVQTVARAKPLVKPALPPPAASAKARGAVKPALAPVPVGN